MNVTIEVKASGTPARVHASQPRRASAQRSGPKMNVPA